MLDQSQGVTSHRDIAAESNAQLFVTGGHGGVVTYDGRGGAMKKRGGPIDRVYLLRNDGRTMGDDGRLLGDAALDVYYGCINFRTGPLQDDVELARRDGRITFIKYSFNANEDENAMEVIGSIPELGIPRDSVLFAGTVEPSIMLCEARNDEILLPYIAWHLDVVVHADVLDWCGANAESVRGAVSGWDKKAPTTTNMLSVNARKGVSFETQQHLGHLRVFL